MKSTNQIGLGTAAIGRPQYINIKQTDMEVSFSVDKFIEKGNQVLDEAYNRGVRFFDTSPGYGLAEELLASWLQKKNDPKIVVSTKWGYTYVANFDPNAKVHEVKEHSLEKLNQQWTFSKTLLPFLKIYQIHSATLDTGVLDNHAILNRLHQLKKEHKLLIGLTTTGSNQLEVLQKAMEITVDGEALFGSYQSTFNILDTSILKIKDQLQQPQLIIKEALANGRLIPNGHYPRYKNLYALLMGLAKKYNVGTDAISMRFCMDHFPNAQVLSGANKKAHLQANLRANDFKLTTEEIDQLYQHSIAATDYWNERKKLEWN
ncbi:aldo/keto reductase [Chryseobacterium indoltheticum]|jgi:aryl-alcohol dehydrogenase-like predicted oxidoreductase|uniref:aldo/keto reductase n=1 Tax=Chryseobacterium indoltheticum TaxID=254 RepID=UPI00242C2574|nr:aldo/keto reductase [Chryseobacterium indoltheticum]MDF2831470.1 oxidoreductase [Chryseobacterium indoltheticum]